MIFVHLNGCGVKVADAGITLLGQGSLNYEMVGGGDDSVDWDRTYSDDEDPPSQSDCDALESVLIQLGVERLVVGHSVWNHISTSCGGLVWLIDVGMSEYYGGSVEVLEITPDGELNVLSGMR